MIDCKDFVAKENIKRFEDLLRGGQLDSRQTETVLQLLAHARQELSAPSDRFGSAGCTDLGPGAEAIAA